jgi:hypothetical protein
VQAVRWPFDNARFRWCIPKGGGAWPLFLPSGLPRLWPPWAWCQQKDGSATINSLLYLLLVDGNEADMLQLIQVPPYQL